MSHLVAHASHSHLFPGATLVVASQLVEQLGRGTSRTMRIVFADGSQTAAELLFGDQPTDVVLEVREHTTAAGTSVPAKLWRVRSRELLPDGALEMRLGDRLPGGDGP